MTRKTQRAVIHAVVFFGLLSLLLFLNRPESNKTFAWNKIQYKTTSATLPEARGFCPDMENISKPALVVSRVPADGDSKWLDVLANSYHLCVYTADAATDKNSVYLQVPANRGHEAMVYLTFLIDNYNHIPSAALLLALNVSAALSPSRYHNLRCDWSISSCVPSSPPQGSLETSLQAVMDPFDARTLSDAALPRALAVLFGGNEYLSAKGNEGVPLGRTIAVRTQCCAQFVVARENIWQHSREEYVALRQWLLDGSSESSKNKELQSGNAAPPDDRVAGKILSYVWHILFTNQSESNAQGSSPATYSGIDLERLNKLACPRADECYCRLYGRCGLEHCISPGSCYGQYQLPKDMRLPDNWAAKHS